MTLRFQEIFLTEPYFVMGGVTETRLQNSKLVNLAENIPANTGLFNLLYHQAGVNTLAKWYRLDTHIADTHNIPIILNCPTLHANAQAIKQSGYKIPEGIEKINADAIHFVRAIREQFLEHSEGIFLSAPVGPKDSSASAAATISLAEAEDYHAAQVRAITAAKPDILFFTGMVALQEALACAKLAAKSGLTYGMGVTINREGLLLDGASLEELIVTIDDAVSPRPFFYAITCTHPAVIKQVLRRPVTAYQRILGLQANASTKPLLGLSKPQQVTIDEPAQFVHALMALADQYRIKIFGGCCGVDDRHFLTLCERIARKTNRPPALT